MSNSALAKFMLHYGVGIQEYLISSDVTSIAFLHDAFDKFYNENENIVKEAVDEIVGQECVLKDDETCWIHPQTGGEVYYETWRELWENDIDCVKVIVKGEMIDFVCEGLGGAYDDLLPLFDDEIEIYLQECLDDEWQDYN